MKLNRFFSSLFLGFITLLTLQAQQTLDIKNVTVETIKNESGVKEKVQLSMDVDITNMKIGYRQMLQLTPKITSSDNQTVATFPTLIVAGSNRYKVLRRNIDFGNIDPKLNPSNWILVKKNEVENGMYHYTASIPYQTWMKGANASVASNLTGCRSCIEPQLAEGTLLASLKGEPYQPNLAVAYIAPEVEAIKNRADKIEAYFNYKVARYELLKDYKNNARELRRIDEFINSFLNDANVNVSNFVIEGFASPEGSFASNKTLSGNRAKAFASYLKTTYQIANNKMQFSGKGEDWDGLKKAVSESNLTNKEEVIAIIERNNTDTEREAQIRKLDNGVTYKKLVDDFYPALRRNTVNVSYVVKGFSLDEAFKAYKEKPSQLSLEEFFRISQTFSKGSKDFIEVFETARSFYPNDEIANLNAAAACIEAKNFPQAAQYIEKAGNSPEANNNRAIIAFHNGDYKTALNYLEQASSKLEIAKSNLMEIKKYETSL